ncbi:germin-like protein 9-3 [Bidens hawaiensis]|uniref:germin-like protein 9-3 n=1 Tax=Bidens hawaiensis TaxID=980011 RepID=UPI0040497E1E
MAITISSSTTPMLLLPLLLILAISSTTQANDPDVLYDFIRPINSTLDASFFTYDGLSGFYNEDPKNFTVLKASMSQFPALYGQSVSYAVLQFPPAGVNPPHTHPRAAELLLVILGTLEVGFVDTANVLYNQTLQEGDMFVFPKGLVHFQYNRNHNESAIALSAFGSANAGLLSVPKSVFITGIDENVLAMSFKTDVPTVQKIELGLKH